MVCLRKLLDSRRLEFHAAPSRTIGLRHHTHNVMACRMQGRQCAAGKFGGARKNNAHEFSFCAGLSAVSLRFQHFGLNAIALEWRQIFNKYFAHQMVQLVLHTNGHQTFSF